MRKFNGILILLTLMLGIAACGNKTETVENQKTDVIEQETEKVQYNSIKFDSITIPAYSGEPYVEVNNNEPFFKDNDYIDESFEIYAKLDNLGRCGVTYACIGTDIMPTEERGEIGQVKPSGWHTVKYDVVNGKYLYNRCHLIGFQLAGENANERNLITGTRYLNIEGMLPFENTVANYVEGTDNHVLYRVTPVFTGNNLVADGVLMEAYSVEDNGEGIKFNVFAYNVQPGIEIDYSTGESRLVGEEIVESETEDKYTENKHGITYILNTQSKKFHLGTCGHAEGIKEEHRESFNGSENWLIDNGYEPCGVCLKDFVLNDIKIYVDDKIREVTESNNCTKESVEKLLMDLEENEYIQAGSIEYDEDTEMFTFIYDDGTLGGITLNEWKSDMN